MTPSPAHQRQVGWALKIATVALALSLIGEKSGMLEQLDFSAGDTGANLVAILVFWTSILAPGFYLCALWALGAFLSRTRATGEFAPEMVKSIRDTGQNLLLGAVCAVLVAPTADTWLTEGFAGVRTILTVENVTIGVIGLALYVIAASGQRLRSELELFV